MKTYCNEYYAKNRIKILERQKEYKKDPKVKLAISIYHKKLLNTEEGKRNNREHQKKYRESERGKKHIKKYCRENKERIKENTYRWRRKNPERAKALDLKHTAKRKAKLMGRR